MPTLRLADPPPSRPLWRTSANPVGRRDRRIYDRPPRTRARNTGAADRISAVWYARREEGGRELARRAGQARSWRRKRYSTPAAGAEPPVGRIHARHTPMRGLDVRRQDVAGLGRDHAAAARGPQLRHLEAVGARRAPGGTARRRRSPTRGRAGRPRRAPARRRRMPRAPRRPPSSPGGGSRRCSPAPAADGTAGGSDSHVLRPMITGAPSVTSLKCARSSGTCHGMPPCAADHAAGLGPDQPDRRRRGIRWAHTATAARMAGWCW